MRQRRWGFAVAAFAAPWVLLAAAEVALRRWWPEGAPAPLTIAAIEPRGARIANPALATRWFRGEAEPPTAPLEPFAPDARDGGLRLVVLGESSAQGFPFPRNAMFSRVVRDALDDRLGAGRVQVINFGIAATNSYAVLDLVPDVLALAPDAVLIYAGHNEYYGADGVASTTSMGLPPALVRTAMQVRRYRLGAALDAAIRRLRPQPAATELAASPSMMERVAGERAIPLESALFSAGVAQYRGNLSRAVGTLRQAGVPVLVGTLASNERDQPPFAGNPREGPAWQAYVAGQRAWAAGDSATARAAFGRARDADVVRFRAPSAFNAVIREVAQATGAVVVPVAEAFAAAAPGGSPGRELFTEHVHPTSLGYALLGRTFAEAIVAQGCFGRPCAGGTMPSASALEARMALSALDSGLVRHRLGALMTRWPFVPPDSVRDYRATVRVRDSIDAIALEGSRGGIGWEDAKIAAMRVHLAAGNTAAARRELDGLRRDRPWDERPIRLAADTWLAERQPARAESLYVAARALQPTAEGSLALAKLAAARGDSRADVVYHDEAARLAPQSAELQLQASYAHGRQRALEPARAAAVRAFRINPALPGLVEWMRALGL